MSLWMKHGRKFLLTNINDVAWQQVSVTSHYIKCHIMWQIVTSKPSKSGCFITARYRGKIIFSQVCVIPSVHGGRGSASSGVGGLHPVGLGVCIRGSPHPGEVCIEGGGGLHPGVVGQTPPGYGQRAGGTHPTGMHSCLLCMYVVCIFAGLPHLRQFKIP